MNISGVFWREFSCLCEKCIIRDHINCVYLSGDNSIFENSKHLILRKWHNFFGSNSTNNSINDDTTNDSSDKELEVEYDETEASALVTKGDVAVVKTGDDYPYYLITVTIILIKGHYLEVFKETKDGDIYYLDNKKVAIISC